MELNSGDATISCGDRWPDESKLIKRSFGGYTPVRVLARSTTLLRSSFKARLPASSRVGGIAVNAANVAISFASAMLTFKSFSSRSMLSNVEFDKLLSKSAVGIDCRC